MKSEKAQIAKAIAGYGIAVAGVAGALVGTVMIIVPEVTSTIVGVTVVPASAAAIAGGVSIIKSIK